MRNSRHLISSLTDPGLESSSLLELTRMISVCSVGNSSFLPERAYLIDEGNSQFSPYQHSGGAVKDRGMGVQQVWFFHLNDLMNAFGQGAGPTSEHEEGKKSIRHKERPIIISYPF